MRNNSPMKIGERIKQRRKALGYTQKELAKRAGVAQSTIGSLEIGTATSTRHLPQIAKALRISMEDLLQGENLEAPAVQEPLQLTEEQRRALNYLEMLTPNQTVEWFRWAENKERENLEIAEHLSSKYGTVRKKG